MKEQAMIPAGYRWFNGQILTAAETDGYNRRSQEINRYLAGGYEAFRDRIEHLADERHMFLTTIFNERVQP